MVRSATLAVILMLTASVSAKDFNNGMVILTQNEVAPATASQEELDVMDTTVRVNSMATTLPLGFAVILRAFHRLEGLKLKSSRAALICRHSGA
jgi:hypothetical protein